MQSLIDDPVTFPQGSAVQEEDLFLFRQGDRQIKEQERLARTSAASEMIGVTAGPPFSGSFSSCPGFVSLSSAQDGSSADFSFPSCLGLMSLSPV